VQRGHARRANQRDPDLPAGAVPGSSPVHKVHAVGIWACIARGFDPIEFRIVEDLVSQRRTVVADVCEVYAAIVLGSGRFEGPDSATLGVVRHPSLLVNVGDDEIARFAS